MRASNKRRSGGVRSHLDCWRCDTKRAWFRRPERTVRTAPPTRKASREERIHDRAHGPVHSARRRTARRRGARRKLSGPPRARDGRVLRRHRRRHHRTRDRPAHGADSRPAIRGREQDRRRLEPRGRRRSPRSQGRLHTAGGVDRQSDQRGRQHFQRIVRLPQGLRADRPADHYAEHPRGASFARREERPGADRTRQGQARPALIRLLGRGDRHASLGRAVQGDDRREDGARALCRQPAGSDRPDRRPHPGPVLARFDGAAACARGKAGRARLHRSQANRDRARSPDHGRGRIAGLRDRLVVWADGPRRRRARCRRHGQPGRQRGAR